MDFTRHYDLSGKHATLSPSTYHWIRYSDEKLEDWLFNKEAMRRGTELHALASECIRLGVRLPATKKTLNAYVNDAIGYKMKPEQLLFATPHCFGTADAIGFKDKEKILRVFDLKTGETPAKPDQLLVYGAIFCIEYNFRPFELQYDFRIYQSDEVAMYEVDPDEIAHIMDRIMTFSNRIDKIREEMYK